MVQRKWIVFWALVAAVAGVAVTLFVTRTGSRAQAASTASSSSSGAAESGGGAGGVKLPAGALAKNPLGTVTVAPVKMAGDIQLVGTVTYDPDHLAQVGPLVGGRVARLAARIGDRVRKGQVLAEIESAEVGQAYAEYIGVRARVVAAEANLRREEELAAKKISSSREREIAESNAVSERAALQAATERLRAIGISAREVAAIGTRQRGVGMAGRVAMRAPIAGVVVRRPVTLGQAVERANDAFQIADTFHVWVDLDLYEKDLPRVHAGQTVEIRAEAAPGELFHGRVAYVVPVIDEATRTAKVRIALPNPQGKLSFGQLVTARLIGDPTRETLKVLAVPRAAIQQVDGRTVVFVRKGDAFQRATVELGYAAGDQVEIRRGVAAGDVVASDGAFLLKSELLR